MIVLRIGDAIIMAFASTHAHNWGHAAVMLNAVSEITQQNALVHQDLLEIHRLDVAEIKMSASQTLAVRMLVALTLLERINVNVSLVVREIQKLAANVHL